uniref:CXXC-type domain-containing protein n=1 Tax=Romanomermis culicivorax TaxID=13658 RepID=A0A915KAV9_ROMCU
MVKFGRNINRCLQCEGCRNDYCRRCVFCRDMARFGGQNVRRQACVQMRCHKILAKVLRTTVNKYRIPCGVCHYCTKNVEKDCGYCTICFDRMFFQNRFFPGALCNKRKCKSVKLRRITPQQQETLELQPVVVNDEKSMENSIDSVVKHIREGGKSEIIVEDCKEKREKSVNLKCVKRRKLLAIRKREKFKLYTTSRLRNLRQKVVVKQSVCEENPALHQKVDDHKKEENKTKSFLAALQKPNNPLEEAFAEILDDDCKLENEKSPDIEQLIGEILDKIFALQKLSPEQTLKLFATLPSAEFVRRLPNCENFDEPISPLSIDPVTVITKNGGADDDDLSIDPILLGYIVSLDKDQLTSRLMSSSSFSLTSGLQNSNSSLQNNENAQLQMKLMQMHQEHHNYACIPK